MLTSDRRTQSFAVCLSGLAGYVDAVGFIRLGGFFVSFMSGNSTQMGVGLVRDVDHSTLAASLIGMFVLGVMAGTSIGRLAKSRRHPAVLALVTVLLAMAAFLDAMGRDRLAVFAMALAMGAENAAFERGGEVQIGLTYMTGTLVKLGQRLAAAFFGDEPWAWLPYLLLWASLVIGAGAGALAYAHLGTASLWPAVAAAAILTGAAIKTNPISKEGPPV